MPTAVVESEVRVPRGTERVAWSRTTLATIPVDGKWHPLKDCGRTTAYQTARHLNLGLDLSDNPQFEFGARAIDDQTSELLVRRLRP